ncbi:MAG TPA: site-specific integrase [Nitrospiraceae bacterium]|nr:site-specific integrase [Nitrospiraceae bacterium]
MAKIIRREWMSKGPLGKRVRHVAFGYTLAFNGKRERKVSSAWTCEEEALKALSARQQQIRPGQTDRPADVTLGHVVERYLKFKSDHGKRSLHEDKRILEKQLLQTFGAGLLIRQLSAEKITAYEEQRIETVSAWTVRNELTVLRHMLRLAHKKWGYLDRVPEIELPKAPNGRTRYLTEGEITKLLAACAQSRNPHLTAIVTLALNTGMRKGEILGLTWERVELDKDLGFNARITLYETKNGEPRGVPLNTAAGAALSALESDLHKRIGRVFKRRDGSAWGQIRTGFETAVERAGLSDFRFHDLRHTAASHLAMRGRPLKEVQEILGHKSFSMTLRYAHLSPRHLRTAVESLAGLTPEPSSTGDKWTHKRAHSVESDTDRKVPTS